MTWSSSLLVVGLLLVGAFSSAAQQARTQPLDPPTRHAVVDSVRAAIAAIYVFPDTAKRMAAFLAQRSGSGAYDTIGDWRALGAALTRDLRSVHADAHLRIEYDPNEAARAADTTHREARDRRPQDRRNNYYFRSLRILPGNIGYLEFWQFPDTSMEARKTVRAAMQFLAYTDALILDLRDNRGGSAAMTCEITGYFVNGRAHWGDSYNRLSDRWTEGVTENKPEITGGISLGMPLTVLTSSWTFSGAEGLAYGLKYGRHARIVGERTAGGAHVVRRVGLGNGYVAFVPYIRSANVVTKTDWEGTGVEPDVAADAPDALLRAQEAILNERLAAAKDSTTALGITWALNDARAAGRDVVVPVTTLERYVGTFEEYTFSVREGRLYGVNGSRNNKLTRLRAVTPSLFEIDAESQAEFLVDPTGAVTTMRLLWNDGAVDIVHRTR